MDRKMNTYAIEIIVDSNYDFYKIYDDYEFIAEDDKDALKKVLKIQRECERRLRKAGVDPDEYQILTNHVYRFNKETHNWDEVDFQE